MKEIIALSGISGVGKTYLRTHDEKLCLLPYVDIANIYAEHPEISPVNAFTWFLIYIQEALAKYDVIVVEASLLVTSSQRHRLKMAADILEAKLTYINVPIQPRNILMARIQSDLEHSLMVAANSEEEQTAQRYYDKRKDFIRAFAS